MKFELARGLEILIRTPQVLISLLGNISNEWSASSGDKDNWGPYDVVGHLIHGEKTDWIRRAEIIRAGDITRTFDEFDRLAQFDARRDASLADLLTEFERLRNANISTLRDWDLGPEDLSLRAIHPQFGEVSLEQLLSTWVVHDLNHLQQVVKYMARQYSDNVGPWKEYLSILGN